MTMELRRERLRELAPLFEGLDVHLAAAAVQRAKVPGRALVDRWPAPRAGLLWCGHRLYLAGQSQGTAAGEAMARALTETALPALTAAGEPAFMLTYEPETWTPVLDKALADYAPMRRPQQYYEWRPGQAATPPEPPALPEGYHIRPVDGALLAQTHWRNRQRLVDEILVEGPSEAHYLANRFGVCVVTGETLAGWCLSEFNLDDRCEVGIETVEGHQRQGLATAMAAALLAEAVGRGIRLVGWHCFAENEGSSRTALKAGFRLALEYQATFAYFDQVVNLAVNGIQRFEAGMYEAAADWYDRALSAGEGPVWVYWNAACASARAGRERLALGYLHAAVDHGFHDLGRLQQNEHLASLHETTGWLAVVDRLARGAAEE